MGQKPSNLGGRLSNKQLPLTWIFRRERRTCNPNPEQPIKFQYKTRRKHSPEEKIHNNLSKNVNEVKCRIVKTQNVLRTKSEPNLNVDRKDRHKHRRKRIREDWGVEQFGYEIQDVDDFLTKVSFLSSIILKWIDYPWAPRQFLVGYNSQVWLEEECGLYLPVHSSHIQCLVCQRGN